MGKIERIGVSKVRLIVNQEFEWVFREQFEEDYGIDAQIEIRKSDYLSGKLLAVQIKSGKSYFREITNENNVVFRFDKKHYEYWNQYNLNVILVLYNPDTEECIWEAINSNTVIAVSDDRYKVLIPKKQTFDRTSKYRLLILAYNDIDELICDSNMLFSTNEELGVFKAFLEKYQIDITKNVCIKEQIEDSNRNIENNISFLNEVNLVQENVLVEKIYDASKMMYRRYSESGEKFSFSILEPLLPKGYIKLKQYQTLARTEGTYEIEDLQTIISNRKKNLLIIGEGGIGKTTFFYNILKSEYEKQTRNISLMIPIYIELNSCPPEIGNWYNNETHSTDFILRYVAKMLYGGSYNSISRQQLDQIDRLFLTNNENAPQFLLLLDGFNEVSNDKVKNENNKDDDSTVREQLSNEITKLMSYSNINILITSRPTQTCFFSDKIDCVELIGVSEENIRGHLEQSGYTEIEINLIFSKDTLMKCLRVPLFLCMFTSNRYDIEYLPLNQGEILYHFFHKKSVFYNEREHFDDYQTGKLNQKQMSYILDFLLPYVGWVMEMYELFSVSREKLEEYIINFFHIFPKLFLQTKTNPFENFLYQREEIQKVISVIGPKKNIVDIAYQDIIDCIVDFLSILYERQESVEENTLYGFHHHYFRDYFAAMFDVQMLRMVQHIYKINAEIDESTLMHMLNGHRWHDNKLMFVGQILNEHRNKPILDENDYWYIPEPIYLEQGILQNVLGYIRWKTELEIEKQAIWNVLLKNVIECIRIVRGELSNVDFSYLDLRGCCFYNTICSRVGVHNVVATRFIGAKMDINCFLPEGHTSGIQEFVFHGNELFTLDPQGIIKIWDCITGKVLHTLSGGNPFSFAEFDYQVTGFLKVSNNEEYIITKNYPLEENEYPSVLYQKLNEEIFTHTLYPDRKFSLISYIGFGHDNKEILAIFDNRYFYIFYLEKNEKAEFFLEFSRNTTYVYPAEDADTFYILTSDYIFQDDEEKEEQETETIIQCEVFRFEKNGKYECLLSYKMIDKPMIYAVDEKRHFLIYYDAIDAAIKKITLDTEIVDTVVENVTETPIGIYQRPQRDSELFVFFPHRFYVIDHTKLYSNFQTNSLLAYSAEDKTIMDEVAPGQNRILLQDKLEQFYELNLLTDQLNIKYSLEKTYINGLFKDKDRKLIICSDYYSRSVCIYEAESFRQKQTFSYNYPGYSLFLSSYSDRDSVIALLFSNTQHEIILLQNMLTGREEIIYSDFLYNQEVVSLFFVKNIEGLVICSTKKVLYYNTKMKTMELLYQVLDKEKILDAYGSTQGNIYVAATDYDVKGNIIPYFYCFEFCSGKEKYIKKYKQEMLPINNELMEFFSIMVEDQEFEEESSNLIGELPYKICKGSILKDEKEIRSDLSVRRYFEDQSEDTIVKVRPFSIRYFCYQNHILQTRSYSEKDSAVIQYWDGEEAILVKESNKIEEWSMGNQLTRKRSYVARIDGNDLGWDYLLPISADKMIGCHSLNELCIIDRVKGEVVGEIKYNPGVVIAKCKFQRCKMEGDLNNFIIQNSGEV